MEIDAQEAELLLKRARADHANAIQEIARLEALKSQSDGLAKLVEALEMMFPALMEPTSPAPTPESEVPADVCSQDEVGQTASDSAPRMRPEGPAATTSVKQLLTNNPTHWYTGREVIAIFRENDRPGTDTAIRLALKRAADTGFADRKVDADGGQTFRLHATEPVVAAGVSTS